MRAAPFFRKVTADVRKWSRAMSSVIGLASKVPEPQRAEVRDSIVALRDHCDSFLVRMEEERSIIPAGLLDKAEREWQ